MERALQRRKGNAIELERQLEQTQELLLEKYIQLGKSIYEVAEKNMDEINSLTDKLIAIKRAISIDRNDLECPECMAMNSAENRFCSRCGAKLPRSKEDIQNERK